MAMTSSSIESVMAIFHGFGEFGSAIERHLATSGDFSVAEL